MESWPLPRTALLRIFEDRTPECVLVKAPHVILITGQILEGLLQITSQTSLNIDPRAQLNRSTSGRDSVLTSIQGHSCVSIVNCEHYGSQVLNLKLYLISLSFLPNHLCTYSKNNNLPSITYVPGTILEFMEFIISC